MSLANGREVFVAKKVSVRQKELLSDAGETFSCNDHKTSQRIHYISCHTEIQVINKTATWATRVKTIFVILSGVCEQLGSQQAALSQVNSHLGALICLIYSNALGFHWCMQNINSDSFKERSIVTKVNVNHLFTVTWGTNFNSKISYYKKKSNVFK